MPGRTFNSSSYRYGFNGKENDNEVKGEGNQQDYGMRIYDSRLGRFLSVDPLTKSFPELTPYQFGSNNPIWNIDLDGLEGVRYTDPKQMLYEAGGDISNAMAKVVDKFSAKVEGGYTWFKELFSKDNAKVSLEKTTTYSAALSFNLVESLNYIKYQNTSKGGPSGMNINLEKTQSIAVVTEAQVSIATAKNKMMSDSKGIKTDETTVDVATTMWGIPADITGIQNKTSLGNNALSIGVNLKPVPNVKLPLVLKNTQSTNGNKKAEVKIGGEVKIGVNSGIKVFGNGYVGITY